MVAGDGEREGDCRGDRSAIICHLGCSCSVEGSGIPPEQFASVFLDQGNLGVATISQGPSLNRRHAQNEEKFSKGTIYKDAGMA